jgi:hypothetical protein
MMERWIARPVWHDPWDVECGSTQSLQLWLCGALALNFLSFRSAAYATQSISRYLIIVTARIIDWLEWAFIKTSLRRYEPFPNSPNVPLNDARPSRPFSSTPGVLIRHFIKLVVFDTVHYLMQYTRPSMNDPGDTLVDPSLTLIPRYAKVPFLGTCGAVVVYTSVGVLYHFARLIGHFLLRQPDWAGHRSPTAHGRPRRS